MPRSAKSCCRVSRAFFTSARSGRSPSPNSASSSSTFSGRPAASSAPSMMFFSSFFFSGFMGQLLPIHVYLDLLQVHLVHARRRLHVYLREGLGLHQFDERLLDEFEQRQEGHHHAETSLFGDEQCGELAEV